MKVLVEAPVFPVERIRELLDGLGVQVEAPARPYAGEEVVGLLIWEAVTEEDMARLPNLRVVVTGSVGFDHVDLEAAKRRGIWVCNVPDYCVDEVADSTIALLLTLARGIVVLDRDVRNGGWNDHAAGMLARLDEIKLGVIGFGRIGRAVARRAQALKIDVAASDPLVPAAAMTAAGVRAASFDDLLRTCNAITMHVPLTKGSDHLIGARELAIMPPRSYLVNTARGRLVDIDAVVSALESGQLAGAAIDVLDVEPPTRRQPMPQHPRLVVTPHAAWLSPRSEAELLRRAAASLRAVLEGREPQGIVVAGGDARR